MQFCGGSWFLSRLCLSYFLKIINRILITSVNYEKTMAHYFALKCSLKPPLMKPRNFGKRIATRCKHTLESTSKTMIRRKQNRAYTAKRVDSPTEFMSKKEQNR